jgi:signal transduction histidine kinase
LSLPDFNFRTFGFSDIFFKFPSFVKYTSRNSVSKINKTTRENNFSADIEAVNNIPIISQLLDVVCHTTGMGFAAVARVTEDRWITCTAKDNISFGIKKGDELKVETTICQEVRQNNKAVIIDHVKEDPEFCGHPTPALYGFQSYVSVPIVRKDGSFFGTLCAIDPKPAKVNTPEVIAMFKLFADLISYHLQTIEDMESANSRLEDEKHHSQLREQFIAILGHDLRNPIATTKMSAEILLKTSKEAMTLKQAKTIKATNFRMEGLIDNMLDFARGKLGEGIILNRQMNNGSLEKILTQVVNEVDTVESNREINVNIDLKEEVNCDKERVAQLLSNLLINATTHGSHEDPIEVEAYAEDGEFCVSVTNGGEKIPDEAIRHLFQPFYRDEVRPGKQGLGLGLYIASEIAHAHDGKLHVRSTDENTCFTFKMPLTPAEE